MADKVQTLFVSLEARINQYQAQMAKALATSNSTARKVESRFATMNKSVANSFGGLVAGVASAAALRGAQQLIDASTRIENSLKVAGLAGADLTRVYDSLFISAQKNAAPVEALVELYSRASLVQKELGVSTQELLGFTDKVAVALRVSGKSAAESSGALLQLSQALGSGIVRAEEFNSILEGALPIAQAAAAGLKEAGGSVAKLRSLVVDGKVSSEAFFRAFEAGSFILTDKVASAELTVSNGFTRLQNVLVDAAGKFDDATGASGALSGGLDGLAGFVDKVGTAFRDNKEPIGEFFAAIRNGAQETSTFLKGKQGANGETTFFEPIDFNQLGDWIEGTFFPQRQRNLDVDQTPGSLPVPTPRFMPGDLPVPAGPVPVTVVRAPRTPVSPTDPNLKAFREADAASLAALNKPKQITLEDYPLSPAGTGTAKTPAQKFADDLAAQKRKNEAIREETALRATLNPMVNDYGYAVEKLRVQQEIENAAVAAGLELTPDRKKAIAELAQGYAEATVEAEKLTLAQDKAAESMADWFAAGRDMARGFIDDLVEGKTAAEALGGAFSQLGSKLVDLGLGAIFGTGKGDFGALGDLLGFASGTANTGGVRGQVKGFVHGQEAVIPLPNGGRVPVDIRMPTPMGSSGAAPTIHMPISIDATGADATGLARVESRLAAMQAELPSRIKHVVSRRGKDWI